MIAAEIAAFEEASEELLDNGSAPLGFTNTLVTDTADFANTEGLNEESCLNQVRSDFSTVFNGDATVMPQTDASRGEKHIYDEAVELCIEKMNDQITEAAAEIDAKIDGYTADAAKQENKARETFLRLIESSMVKLHGLTDLTATEVVTLKDAIINKRDDYADEVMGWSTGLAETLMQFSDGVAVSDNESTDLVDESKKAGFVVRAEDKLNKFVLEVGSSDASGEAPDDGEEDAAGEWLEAYFDDKFEELNDAIKTESLIGENLTDEIEKWLMNHVTDLQDALAEICEQEHAYHYHPPGFHVDQTAIELQAFQQLSEKFALVVVQMTGQFDAWSTTIMEKITDLKEDKKEDIDLRRRAAEHSLTMASNSFGEGIEFVRGSVEMKAVADQEKIMETCTDAREIVTYQLSEKKDNLWRQISYLTKKLYADERPDYNAKIKHEILVLFKEFKDVIVECTHNINESQHEKWAEY